jgi:hypothetical protein
MRFKEADALLETSGRTAKFDKEEAIGGPVQLSNIGAQNIYRDVEGANQGREDRARGARAEKLQLQENRPWMCCSSAQIFSQMLETDVASQQALCCPARRTQ